VAATSKECREATSKERTGWSLTRDVAECVLETWLVSDHPGRGSKEASPKFF